MMIDVLTELKYLEYIPESDNESCNKTMNQIIIEWAGGVECLAYGVL
jgi:hypothetical protein